MPDFDPAMLPPIPDVIPPELRKLAVDNTLGGFHRKVTPQQIGMLMALIVGTLSDPRWGVKVGMEIKPDNTGWVLTVDLPDTDTQEDVAIPDDIDQ